MTKVNSVEEFARRLRERMVLWAHPTQGQPTVSQLSPDDWEPAFSADAIELFALQFDLNEPYRIFCEARGITPQTISHWSNIPAVPSAAFKELELSCIPRHERTRVFFSSGTTKQQPSRHFHNAQSLALYEMSLSTWFEAAFSGQASVKGMRGLALTPTPAEAPNSSLVHMFETLREKMDRADFSFTGKLAADGAWTVDCAASLQALAASESSGTPVLVLGTAFSYVHFLDYLAAREMLIQLPPGSRILETGGYKNRSRAIPKSDLHALIFSRLGVPASGIVSEYGMSELSSQAYDILGNTHANRCFRFPPWAKVQLVSPETGRPVAKGDPGLIRVFDLANAYSVLAIQTEDLAVQKGEGFELLGRAISAEPRGCSLMTTA